MEVFEAEIEDIPELCDLLGYLFEHEVEFKPDISSQSCGLQKILENNELGAVLILREKDKAVGMVTLLFTISTALGGMVALLEDMVVIPSERGKGYGSRLLRAAMDYANRKECKRITLLTDDTNIKAQKFYRHHGFAHSSMHPMRYLIISDNS